jgi:hypothetical protein
MYVKKIKRKCGVRGCKNTVSYAISKSREMGNSIIACKECLLEALAVIEEQNKPVTENFPEAEAVDETVSDAPAEEEAPTETENPKTRQRKK